MSALIYCPFPDAGTAAAVARRLLAEKLVACVNIGSAIEALFVWSGEEGSGSEVPALFKSHAALLDAAVRRLEALHPYDAPAIMGWRCDSVGSATERWLGELSGD